MRYRVIGANRDTGARQTLEVEAESKAAAERKAMQSGMTVNRVEDITDGHASQVGSTNRRANGLHPVLKLILLVAILAAACYLVWPYVRGAIQR